VLEDNSYVQNFFLSHKPKKNKTMEGASGEPDEPDRIWQTCCSKSSSSFLHYVSQLIVTSSVLALSIGMLASGSKDALYPSLITLVLGVYLPTPTHKPAFARPSGNRPTAPFNNLPDDQTGRFAL
jgi:hypothetical protein